MTIRRRGLRALAFGNIVGGAVVLATIGAGTAPAVTAAPAAGVNGLWPAGTNFGAEHEKESVPPDAIADSDSVGNQLRYAAQARGLGIAERGLKWVNVGPLGQDDPPAYPTGPVRFSRSTGMGAAVAVDPRDKSGNSVYIGNMGGLWHSRDGGEHWRALGDGVFARSAVGAIAVDPKRPKDLYVGTGIGYLTISGDAPGSGVYVSRDGGRTFSRPAANIKGYAVNAIQVTPSGVLVGTVNGLYVSTNRGKSFKRVALPSDEAHKKPAKGAFANWISAITVHPTNPKSITVAIGMPYGKRKNPEGKPLSPGNGLYRSTTGATGKFGYLASSSGLTNPEASTEPLGRIMLSYGPTAGGDKPVLWAIVSDAGLLNKQQPAGLDLVGSTTGQTLNRTSTLLNGLYRSEDDGATWTLKANPASLTASINEGLGIYPALGYGVGVQAFYNLWVLADPEVPDQVYFGLEEVFQSVANAGPTPGVADFEVIQRYWDVCGSTTYLENVFTGVSCPDQTPYYGGVSTHPDQHAAAAVTLPDGKVRLYTANDGGYFREDAHALPDGRTGFDNGGWVAMNTLASVQPYQVARKSDGEYLIGLQDNGGGFFARGKPATLVTSGDGTHALATSDPDVFYFSAQGAILWVTEDHGKTIRNMQPDLTGAAFLSPIVIDPTDENHLVAAARDVHETLKGPDTQTVLDPLTYTVVQTDWTQTFDAGLSPTKNGTADVPWASQALAVRGAVVYSAICGLCRNALGDPKLIRTTVATNSEPACIPKKAGADCWHVAKGKGLPHVAISNVAIDPQSTRTIYVTLNENSMVGYDQRVVGSQRVMVSTNSGDSFSDITGNLPRSNARDVVVRDGKVIVATDHGVFVAPKGSKRWSRLAAGLPQTRVYDLQLDPQGRHLTASLYGRGVWNLDFGRKARTHSSGAGPNGEPLDPTSAPERVPSLPRLPEGVVEALAVLAMLFGFGLLGLTRRRPALA